jgi:drug/metabolite transporter (DMT)-like permease
MDVSTLRFEKIGLTLAGGLLFSVGLTTVSVANRYVPPATVTALRMLMASAVLGGLLVALKPSFAINGRNLADIGMAGLLNVALPFFFVAWGLTYASSTLVAILYNTTPFFTLLIAHWLLPDERLNALKIIGTVAVVAGASLLLTTNASGLTGDSSQGWIGQLLALAGALVSAIGVIYSRSRLRGLDTFAITAWQVFASLVFLVPVALLRDGLPAFNFPGQVWALLLASVISGPVLSFWLFFYTVKKYSASLAGFASIATPLFTVVVGRLFLGEVLTLPIVIGSLLVLAGVWSLQYF